MSAVDITITCDASKAFMALGRMMQLVAATAREFATTIEALTVMIATSRAIDELDIPESDIRNVTRVDNGWIVRLWNGRRIPLPARYPQEQKP